MTPTRGTRVYRRVVGITPCAYTVWDEVDTNSGAAGVVWGVDAEAARARVIDAARAYRDFVKPRQHTLTPETIAEWHAVKDAFYAALDALGDDDA